MKHVRSWKPLCPLVVLRRIIFREGKWLGELSGSGLEIPEGSLYSISLSELGERRSLSGMVGFYYKSTTGDAKRWPLYIVKCFEVGI